MTPGQIAFDADPGGREVAGEALRQADHAVLRGGVGRPVRQPDQAAHGREVDDRPAAGLPHAAGDGLAAVEDPAQVDGEDVLPLLGGQRVDVADLADAGAGDEDVDPARLHRDGSDGALDVVGAPDVAVHEERAVGARRLEGRLHLLARCPRTVEAGDPRPLPGEALGDGAADPAADPGHECDSTVQQHVVLRSRSRNPVGK